MFCLAMSLEAISVLMALNLQSDSNLDTLQNDLYRVTRNKVDIPFLSIVGSRTERMTKYVCLVGGILPCLVAML